MKYATTLNIFRQRYNEVTPLIDGALPKNERSRFKIWKDINPYNPGTDDLNTAEIEALFYSDLFGDELTKIQNQNSYKDASILQRILSSLEQYEHSGLVLTKLSVTLGDFIEVLKEEYEKSSIIVKQYQVLSRIVEILSALTNDIEQMKEMQEDIKQESKASQKFTEKATETFYGEKAELSGIEEELRKAVNRCNTYYERCCSIGFDENSLTKPYAVNITKIPINDEVEQYLSLSETETINRIVELKHANTKKNSELTALNIFIGNYEREQQNIEKQKPHKYEEYHEQLIQLLQKIEGMSQILNENNALLKNLSNKTNINKDEIERDNAKKKYYFEVSKYLAFRVGLFRHIDKIYRAKIVDLVSGKIITEDNTVIYIADMGTGQSQSAYLLSLLNVRNDNRKIIALFDEIAMMDESSLHPICEKLKALQKDDKLLLGILVQKGNQLKVESIE